MLKRSCITASIAALVLLFSPAGNSGQNPSVTFNKDILPVLQKNCQSCHRPGQIAPMSLLTYQEARPWAKAIKTAVIGRTMPPWFADPKYGHILNERRLTDSEIDAISKWVDGGAPEGNEKAPPAIQWPEDGWQIKPDYIVEGPTYEVPAKGIVEWTWYVVPGGFAKDTWVTSIEVLPSQKAVTHHVCLSYVQHTPDIEYFKPVLPRQIQRDENGNEIRGRGGARGGPPVGNITGGQGGPGGQRSAATGVAAVVPGGSVLAAIFGRSAGTALIEECYEPGRPPADFRPYNAAKLIPAGTDIAVNVHYTPNGKPVTDHVRIGFTLAKETPKRRYLAMSTSSPSGPDQFAIPPNNGNWEAPPAVVTFNQDVELVGLMPHMHVRGKAARIDLEYPDGKKETILNVPHYDFNWQLWYDTSIKVPKGSTMRAYAWYDNSANNKFNPNPNATVYYGDQTWEEMHFPSYGIVLNDLTIDPRTVIRNVGPGNRGN